MVCRGLIPLVHAIGPVPVLSSGKRVEIRADHNTECRRTAWESQLSRNLENEYAENFL